MHSTNFSPPKTQNLCLTDKMGSDVVEPPHLCIGVGASEGARTKDQSPVIGAWIFCESQRAEPRGATLSMRHFFGSNAKW